MFSTTIRIRPHGSPTSIFPLKLSLHSVFRARTGLALHGGFYVACLLHSSLPDGTGFDVRRWDAGVGFGADFIVGHFVIGPEVQYGLTRLTKPGSDHNTTYALTLGYRF